MNILILNGSPRPQGNTKKLVNAFAEGAGSNGHQVKIIDVCRKNIKGCLGCEYCHTKGNSVCVQKDDMQEVYTLLKEAEMVVFASPVYYHDLSAQLRCVIDRFYAIGYPGQLEKLKKTALILSSDSPDVYEGIEYTYQKNFIEYMKLTDAGRLKIAGDVTEDALKQANEMGKSI